MQSKKKQVHKQRKEIHRLLSEGKFFNSITETNRLRKDTNRLLSKGMSNFYLKVTIATFSKLRFSGFKKFSPGQFLESSNSRRYH